MVGLWVLAPVIVRVLFERGAFDGVDTAMTAWALRAYVFGLLGVASVRVLAAVFYALERPRVAVAAASVALVVNAVCDLALMGPTDPAANWWGASMLAQAGALLRVADLDHAGLALGTGIAATVNAALLFVFARKRLVSLHFAPLARSAVLHAAAALAMAAALLIWAKVARSYGPYAELGGGMVVGIAVYTGSALAIGSAEIQRLFRGIRGLIVR
jgi:putative peptidoglycan lipid II flippase